MMNPSCTFSEDQTLDHIGDAAGRNRECGAGDGIRTRDILLGKSSARVRCGVSVDRRACVAQLGCRDELVFGSRACRNVSLAQCV
jgi:hypothetical protein